MKCSRSDVRKKAVALPELRFENQTLTSFAGLIIFQRFFATIDLKSRIRECFRHVNRGKVFNRSTVFLQMVIHLLLGYRELQHCRYYRDDPLVKRLLGLKRLPDVATISRMLRETSSDTVDRLRGVLREFVLQRLMSLVPARITLDFDGSVQSTKGHREGTAVGFNKKKKGARSYYPLFCTIAQLGQVLDFLHRPGNVHDSNGAKAFILACIDRVRVALPHVQIEVRMDSAFFSDEIVMALAERGVEFTISVPFERFVALKKMVQQRRRWRRMDGQTRYFESSWKPDCWNQRCRFLFVRTRVKKQQKGPIQLDLFEPHEHGYEFKVIVTNKTTGAKRAVQYHEGRGSQENIFGELKSHCHLDYVPVRTLCGNQMYLLAGLFAFNLSRELQMQATAPSRGTTAKRACFWAFEKLDTLRKTLIQRAGRLTQPKGVLTLTISANDWIRTRLLNTLEAIQPATG
jgi:hypothetical protein